MPSTYQKSRVALAPAFLQTPFAAAHQAAIGAVQDYIVDRAKQSVKARFAGLAPADALAQIGLERQIPRGPNESQANYAARLIAAWSTWPWAGTAFGLLSALDAGGFIRPEVRIQNGVRYYLDANKALVVEARPNTWYIDSNLTFWSRFVVLLQPQTSISAVTRGGGATVDVALSGVPRGNLNVTLTVTVGSGPTPSTVSYNVTGDITESGTFSPSGGAYAGPFTIGTTGVMVTFPSSGYPVGWSWSFSTTFVAPAADGSTDQQRCAQLIKTWKPAHATCTDVWVVYGGLTWGTFPITATWGSQGRATWGSGLATVVRWSP